MNASERLKKRMEELGHRAKRSLGQNFLVSDLVIEKIIKKVKFQNPEALIEVGPGLGALTDELKNVTSSLKLIEMDQDLAAYWGEQGFEVIEGDALQIDWKPLVKPGTGFVSNLPYQISSSIVIERSMDSEPLDFMVLMFQKEVAQRIQAPVRRDDYGMLSVIAQSFWTVETVSEAGPKDFYPPPRVASRVLMFKPIKADISNRESYLSLVKEAFKQRRKLLKSNLRGLLNQYGVPENDFVDWLAKSGLKETARAEEVSPHLYKDLYEYLSHSRKQKSFS